MRSFPLLATLIAGPAVASDHAEAPLAAANVGADLSDLYVWHSGDTLNAILTLGWHEVGGIYIPFDDKAIFGIHIDNDGDHQPDHDIWIRFAADPAIGRAVQIEGLPGGEPVFSGPIETELDGGNGTRAMAMLADDPFFMDLEGFVETVSTGTLSFDGTRDSLAGSRVDAVVLQMDLTAATAGNTTIDVWATSGRKE